MTQRSWAGIAAGLAMILVVGALPAAAWAARDAAFDKAFASFGRAMAGDGAAIDEAAAAFEALRRAQPADPVLLAYAGASLSMRAATTMMPWKKLGYAEDGLAEIDKALALLAPAHERAGTDAPAAVLEVKFVAASTFLAVPDFMNRAPRGRILLAEVIGSPLFEAAPLPFRGQVWMRAAAQAIKEQRNAEARAWLDAVVRHGAPQAAAAKARLAEIGT